ncbi:ARM repeat-containing protein [Wilcoxina mikolae CBS 423.85]|nr:ARM repeat-containing protein [Wilcoxina mikolae CBS 423.85]
MGQNYSSTAALEGNTRAGIEIPELSDISYDKSLGSARFLKTIRARHADGLVVIKIFAKPHASFQLDHHRCQLIRDQEALESIVNAFPYERLVETERAAFLVRQYLYSSLYDRISTRPFLEKIEKLWIAFQLLCGLRDCHASGVHHGDIKAENILVTSWNWIYLSDFAPFKPIYLPADNPADFSYFFDTSGRRICYIAPERFLDAGQKRDDTKITDEMDIFSLGCVIAELFLEGTPLFTLSQLFKYRSGEYDPAPYLAKIEDPGIRQLVQHMISLDSSLRYSAEKYLTKWRRKAFPDYFYSFLHQYIAFVTDPTSGRNLVEGRNEFYGRADDRIDRIYHDFDKISFFLGFDPDDDLGNKASHPNDIIPVDLNIPSYLPHSSGVRHRHVVSDDGTLIFLSLVASSLRNTSRTGARVRGCDMMLAFAERVTDESKMDRCLPYLVTLLGDENVVVQVAVIRALTQLMEIVEVVSPTNSHVFPDYILPKLSHFVNSENALVRATFASCLASLANSASRFLDMAQALRADGVLPTTDPEAEAGYITTSAQALFDTSKNTLVLYFQDHAKALLTDSDSAVRRAFLRSVSRLCVFFGQSKANDIILSHLNTYLNDKDWILRCAFFETVTGIATYLGCVALEEYIMPLMVQSLTDPEEFVVEKVLRSLANMAELGLFQRSKTWELVDIIGRLTMHPNVWIRQGAVGFIAASTKWLAPADIYCIVYPLVQPYLKTKMVDLSTLSLLETLNKPLSRNVFDMAVIWATQARSGLFWAPAQRQRTFVFGSTNNCLHKTFARVAPGGGNHRIVKSHEDENWLNKLRNLGMSSNDEWKIVTLREYIWRVAQSRPTLLSDNSNSLSSTTISLQNLKVTPRTIFFDENESFFNFRTPISAAEYLPSPLTIADALIHASKTIDRPLRKLRSKSQMRQVVSDIRRQHQNVESGRNMSESGRTTPSILTVQSDTNFACAVTTKPLQIPLVSLDRSGESSASSSSIENGIALRHKSSKTSLLHRAMAPSKASAATSTVSATAFGSVVGPFATDASKGTIHISAEEPVYNFRAAHSYDGYDPYILNLLDSMYLQNYPSDTIEFGPTIVPLQRRQPIRKSNDRHTGGTWKPEGTLVASFGEHHEPINRVVVAPDHNFFATASDDGTVKVWDSTRLEKNIAFRARQTYKHGSNLKVKALCFVENTRCFVSGASDGSIHVVKVDFSTAAAKYGKMTVMREYQLPEPHEHAVWMEHFKVDSNSILVIATNASNIHALDLRTMNILYTLKNPIYHGTPSCFCLDRKRNWMVVGTSHGILDMWDLRFQLHLKAWGLPRSTPIHKLQIHPSKGRNKWVIVAGGTGQGISIWDCEKTQCKELYRTGPSGGYGWPKSYEPWNVDEESPENILQRFATSLDHLQPPGIGSGSAVDRGVRAFFAAQDVAEGDMDARVLPGFIISAGADRKIRFWNCIRVEGSMVVNGLEVEEPKPTYTSSHPSPNLTIYTEKASQGDTESVSSGGGGAIRGFLGSSGGTGGESGSTGANAGLELSGGKKKHASGRSTRSTVISQQQQQLLKGHLDSVTDVAFLEVPYGMVISVDRGGMVFIYQ